MSKLIVAVVAAAAGYVLGAKAGRDRYEQIRSQVQRARRDPRVQEKTAQAADLIADKASEVAGQVSAAAAQAVHKVKDAKEHSGDSERRHGAGNETAR